MTNRILPSERFNFYKNCKIFLLFFPLLVIVVSGCSTITGSQQQHGDSDENTKVLKEAMALLSDPDVKDKSVAMSEFERACMQGQHYGCHKLGIAFNNGIHGKPQNYQTAKQWYERAAQKGYVPSQLNIANLYAHRLLPLDDETGYRWLAKAHKGLRECRSGAIESETSVSDAERRRMCQLAMNFYRKLLNIYRKRMEGDQMRKIDDSVNATVESPS